MKTHVTIVAALNIGFGILGIFLAIIVFGVLYWAGVISAEPIPIIVGTVVASWLFITSVPEIIGGFGLLKFKPWARILVIIIACIDLLHIPIGTAIGIYELWVLLQEKTTQLFYAESRS